MNQEKIGKFISECRKQKNITQEQLANTLGVSNRTISKWENGVCMPDYSILPTLCKALDITINELLSGEKLTDENYQQKLEENLILNMAELKRRSKKTFLFIIKIVLPLLLVFLILSILEVINHYYDYKKYYLSNKDINVTACATNNLIYVTIKSKDKNPIWIENHFDTNTLEYSAKPYRIRKKSYMNNSPSSHSVTLESYPATHTIKIANKIIYKNGSKIETCKHIND